MNLITMTNLISWSAMVRPFIVLANILIRRTPAIVKMSMICGCIALLEILNGFESVIKCQLWRQRCRGLSLVSNDSKQC
jgi:hypothetical protein